MRYRCVGCERTFAHYSQEIDRSEHSVRLRALMTLMRTLGLSHKAVAHLMSAVERPASGDERLACGARGWQGCGARHEQAHPGPNRL